MKALFLSEDRDQWTLVANLFLAHFRKIKLVCASSSSESLDYLSYDGPFGVLMVDVSLKQEVPLDVATKLLDFCGERPLIFCGPKNLLNSRISQEFMNNHQDVELLEFPLEVAKFQGIVGKSIEWSKKKEFEEAIIELDRKEFLPMKIRNFYLFNKLKYDAYLEVMKDRFVKVISKDERYSHSLIQSYIQKNVKSFYLRKEDNIKMLEQGMETLLELMNNSNLELAVALEYHVKAASLIQQYIRSIGVTQQLQDFVSAIIEKIFKTHLEYSQFKKIMDEFPLKHGDLAEQAILTAYLCLNICDLLGWNSEMSHKKLALSSLIHDATLANDDLCKIVSLADPNLLIFSAAEQEDFRLHPIKAAQIADSFSNYSDTSFIIREHHEMPDGHGFPGKLTSFKITALSAAFIIANNFVTELTLRGPRRDVVELALRKFRSLYGVGNFKNPVATLDVIFR